MHDKLSVWSVFGKTVLDNQPKKVQQHLKW